VADLKIQQLTTATAATEVAVLPMVLDPTGTPLDRSISIANLRKSWVATASIAFTDGDTFRRVTITDANVLSTSNIVGTIRRPNTTDDSADLGYVYLVNVVKVANGSFDVAVACLGWGFDDPTEKAPNETVTLCYTIG
jgi:hypothetical protein